MLNAAGPLFLLLFSFIQKCGSVRRCPFSLPKYPARKLSAMGHCGGSHKAHRFYFDGQTLRRYVFQRLQYHRPAIVPYISPFDRHDFSEPFRARYAQHATKISESVQTINIHQPSWWFFICGHSPLFIATRQTCKYGLPAARDCYLLPVNGPT